MNIGEQKQCLKNPLFCSPKWISHISTHRTPPHERDPKAQLIMYPAKKIQDFWMMDIRSQYGPLAACELKRQVICFTIEKKKNQAVIG